MSVYVSELEPARFSGSVKLRTRSTGDKTSFGRIHGCFAALGMNPMDEAFDAVAKHEFTGVFPICVKWAGHFAGDGFDGVGAWDNSIATFASVEIEVTFHFFHVADDVNFARHSHRNQSRGESAMFENLRGENRVIIAIACASGKKDVR